jgi:electron transport complex protein RnfG
MSEERQPVAQSTHAAPSALYISLRTMVIMMLFSIVFTALMAGTYLATKPLLDASARAEKMKLIGEVLPADSYDNKLLEDAITLSPQAALGLDSPSTAYRARKRGQPVAVVIEAAAADGYSGHIGLILSVRADGRLAAVRVTRHKETPGLGDYIDPKKDRNKKRPWITQFNNTGFDQIGEADWKVKRDGGQIDQMTGATISARAVTNATRKALAWAGGHREQLFATSTGATFSE